MAARESYASDRRQSGGYSSARSKAGQAYMYGNVVAKPEYEPKKNRSSVKRRKKVSRQVQKNRNRALHMGLWQERRQISLRKKFQALCRKS